MSKAYHFVVNSVGKFVPPKYQSFYRHEAGPTTVFFWAPVFKWGLVIAGLADLNRPVEKVSAFQSTALACTGVIWSRYSVVIIPKNYALLSVNIFVGMTGIYQLCRIAKHEYSKKNYP